MEIIRWLSTRTAVRIATDVIEMKVALVTGASSGIEEALAQRLTAKGMEHLEQMGCAYPTHRAHGTL
jgi:hypothetical protein